MAQPWTGSEVLSLLKQVLIETKKLPQIWIPGRTNAAINSVLVQLRKSGRLHDRPPRKVRLWTHHSVRKLIALVKAGDSACAIAKHNLLGENRSFDSISQKMRRLHLGNPKVRKYMKEARRLSRTESETLYAFLRNEGRQLTTREIASRWCNLKLGMIRARRRKLGIAPSWHEARKTYIKQKFGASITIRA